jgi:hypothetical protein
VKIPYRFFQGRGDVGGRFLGGRHRVHDPLGAV